MLKNHCIHFQNCYLIEFHEEYVRIRKSIKSNIFLEETILQLEKDFVMIGVHFDIEKPISIFKEVCIFTFHHIKDLLIYFKLVIQS